MSILSRVYADYLMPSRVQEYENLMALYDARQYEIVSVIDFFDRLKSEKIQNNDKILINRHDIDTDIKTAKEFFEIEQRFGARGSYYFRQKTRDISFMKEIAEYGSEASYHFEELADFAKNTKQPPTASGWV